MIEAYPNNGFKMTFENGWSISVIWSVGSYSSRTNPAETVEISAWDKDEKEYDFYNGELQIGWQDANQLATWVQIISQIEVKNES